MVVTRTAYVLHTMDTPRKPLASVGHIETPRPWPVFELPNRKSYTCAALTDEAVVLYGGAIGLYCLPLCSVWTKKVAGWSARVSLVKGVALGKGWLAVACAPGLLRLFTTAGVQLSVWCLPGRHVAAVGNDQQLALFHQAALAGPDGRQSIAVQRYVALSRAAAPGALLGPPLTLWIRPGSTMIWAGFSDQGRLCWADSLGRMHMLVLGNVWEVICDLAMPQESFIVGVLEASQEICVVPCSSEVPYPDPGRPIAFSLVPFRLPFLLEPRSEYESQHVITCRRIEALLREPCDGKHTCRAKRYFESACHTRDTLLLKQFKFALEHRILKMTAELASQMCTPSLVAKASVIARQHGRDDLADWLNRLPTTHDAERLRCRCPPHVVIRPLTFSEMTFRLACRKELEKQAAVASTETKQVAVAQTTTKHAALTPITANPFTVVPKKRRIEQSMHPRAAPGTKQARTKQLTLPQMMRKLP